MEGSYRYMILEARKKDEFQRHLIRGHPKFAKHNDIWWEFMDKEAKYSKGEDFKIIGIGKITIIHT